MFATRANILVLLELLAFCLAGITTVQARSTIACTNSTRCEDHSLHGNGTSTGNQTTVDTELPPLLNATSMGNQTTVDTELPTQLNTTFTGNETIVDTELLAQLNATSAGNQTNSGLEPTSLMNVTFAGNQTKTTLTETIGSVKPAVGSQPCKGTAPAPVALTTPSGPPNLSSGSNQHKNKPSKGSDSAPAPVNPLGSGRQPDGSEKPENKRVQQQDCGEKPAIKQPSTSSSPKQQEEKEVAKKCRLRLN
jgi:hypothetical protein